MREQMKPTPELLARLDAALDDEQAEVCSNVDKQELLSPSGMEGQQTSPQSVADTQSNKSVNTPGTPKASKTTGKARRHGGLLTIGLSAVAALVLVFSAASVLLNNSSVSGGGDSPRGSLSPTAVADNRTMPDFADYQELYDILEATGLLSDRGYRFEALTGSLSAETTDSAAPPTAVPEIATDISTDSALAIAPGTNADSTSEVAAAPALVEDLAAESMSSLDAMAVGTEDYSGTNVQVVGIDEGDIVKTDGSYIYVLSPSRLEFIIFEAAGKQTRELSRTVVGEQDLLTINDSLQDLYISGSTAVITINRFQGSAVSSAWPTNNPDETVVAFYDVGDPAAPTLITEFGQSGHYQSSRLYNDKLYLISSYFLNSFETNRDDPVTYIPQLIDTGTYGLMKAVDISTMPTVQAPTYTVVASYDVTIHTRVDQKAVIGNASTIYMGYDNLYLGSSLFSDDVSEPYQESVYTVVDYVSKTETQIVRIGINDGMLDVAAQCTFDGALLNQFSLDEYEGNLRLAVTLDDSSYRILRDETHNVESYQPLDAVQTNAVYVLDPSLAIIGSIEGLAEDERIYSVRFTGPVGYMVTFRQMDPLFAIDLSDPTNPTVTSELKIPGFSTYLHPFGQDRLLGFGYDANETASNGMKLSMFDISNPFAVSELFAENVGIANSEALYNHKAVLVDVDRNIIGFPNSDMSGVTKSYHVYRYDDAGGFELRSALELSGWTADYEFYYETSGTRGLFIGDYLYVLSSVYLDVFDLESLEKLTSIEIQDQAEMTDSSMPIRPLIAE
jgi:uncharacterized secreted protein with C-terminal beta-propeller domain